MKHKQEGLHVQIPRAYLSFCSMIQAPRSVGTPPAPLNSMLVLHLDPVIRTPW